MKKSLHARLQKLSHDVDQLVAKRGRFSSACICFPQSEQPEFFYPEEQEIVSSVKCPIHGERFERKEMFRVYIAEWRKEARYQNYLRKSEQYRRAWSVTFPNWPTKEEDDKAVYLVFPDGSKYLAWRKADPFTHIDWREYQIKEPDEQAPATNAKEK